MAVAALVLGIIAIVLAVFTGPFLSWLGIILGAVGIILGAVARKNEPSGMATGGLAVSIVGTALSIIVFVSCMLCVSAGSRALKNDPNFQKSMQQLRQIQQNK